MTIYFAGDFSEQDDGHKGSFLRMAQGELSSNLIIIIRWVFRYFDKKDARLIGVID